MNFISNFQIVLNPQKLYEILDYYFMLELESIQKDKTQKSNPVTVHCTTNSKGHKSLNSLRWSTLNCRLFVIFGVDNFLTAH
jgi:hypothetical protein